MKTKIVSILLLISLLGGCAMYSPQEIFAKPKIPEQYNNLIRAMAQIKGDDFEYAETVSGLNRQSLQLMDLDGDGVDEGIAFMRNLTDAYKICIYIFKQNSGVFEVYDVIEGSESAIYTVSYSNILGEGNFEMLVEWGSASFGERRLSAYKLSEYGVEEILDVQSEKYTVSDMDQDGKNELVVVTDVADGRAADVYTARDGVMQMSARLPLAAMSQHVLAMKSGGVANGASGVYIDCAATGGVVTSLIMREDERYINALPGGMFRSARTFCEDVNGDGIIEIPMSLAADEKTEETSKCYNWGVYSPGGGINVAAFTYHSFSDNFYIAMPIEWSGAVYVERSARRPGQTEISFYSQENLQKRSMMVEDPPAVTPKLLFVIYILTGDMREEFAAQEGRFVIHEREEMIFAAEIYSESYLGATIDEEFVKSSFKIRESEWISDVLFA